MSSSASECFVGLDMGTTNTRAWLVVEGAIVHTARAGVGIRDSAVAGSSLVLREATRGLVDTLLQAAHERGQPQPLAIAAAGMVTSEHGLAEVPHLPAPAGREDLAAGVRSFRWPDVSELPVYLVPGVRTGDVSLLREQIDAADVMRGEETLSMGLQAAGTLPAGARLLNLGSHWKVISLDGAGRICRSATSLSGELLHATQTHTLVAGSVPPSRPDRLDPGWARAGVDEAARSGLERALFCVRLLGQRTAATAEERLSYLVGAFAGSALPWLQRELGPAAAVVIAGGGPLGDLMAGLLREGGGEVRVLTGEEVDQGMARGLAVLTAHCRTPSFQSRQLCL